MTVQDVQGFIDYVGNGSTTSFVFNFRVDDVAWVSVDFTDDLSGISLNIDQDGSPGGSVDYSVAPPNGTAIHIQRAIPITQEMDYTRYDPFDSRSHEDNLDKLTMIIQDLLDGVVADLQSQIDAINATITAALAWEFVTFSGDRTLVIEDAFKMLQSTDTGGTQDVTIPPNTDVPFALGTQISFEQKGTSTLGFIAGSGVTVDVAGTLAVNAQFGTVTLVQDEIDNWVLFGNIAP